MYCSSRRIRSSRGRQPLNRPLAARERGPVRANESMTSLGRVTWSRRCPNRHVVERAMNQQRADAGEQQEDRTRD